MIVSSGTGAVVQVGGPGVGMSAVAGEVGDCFAELFVCGPAESDVFDFSGLAGGGGDSGQAGQRFGGGEAGAAVTDLAEQAGCAEGARAGQGGEICASAWRASCPAISASRTLIWALRLNSTATKAPVVAVPSCRRGRVVRGEPAIERRCRCGRCSRRWPASGQAFDSQPVGAVLAVEAGQKCQADRRVEVGEQPDCAGEHDLQCARSWLATATRWATRSLRARQVWRRVTVAAVSQQRCSRASVRSVCEHERVEPVVFVAGRAVASAQVLDLLADHHNVTPRRAGVDDRPVRAFDRDLPHTSALEHNEQLAQSGGVVLDRAPHISRPCRRRSTPRDHHAPSRFRR